MTKGSGRLAAMNDKTQALAERTVEAQRNDTRTPAEKIADGVAFVLELGDVTDLYFYNGATYRVRWKGRGLGMAEMWLEKKP